MDVPLLSRPYTRLRDEIRAGKRSFSQKTWGPETPTQAEALCNTPMCTAGSFVSMAGEAGWALKQEYGWTGAYVLLHDRAHPGLPPQHTAAIPDEWALAYIEEMAERETEKSAQPS
ncbi:MAG TPA: hypothetical protein DHW63_00360 [Hyphomonadaceae bacterium]|nr:hypothetical protein [Hyphomonadaceae bacterium]